MSSIRNFVPHVSRSGPLLALLMLIPMSAGLPRAQAGPRTSAPGAIPLRLTHRAQPDDVLARRFDARLEHPAALTLTCQDPGDPQEKHILTRPAAAEHHFVLRGLKASTRYVCRLETDQNPRASVTAEFGTAALPADLTPPKLIIPSVNATRTAYTLYNYGRMSRGTWKMLSNYLVILDAAGNVRWYYPGLGCDDLDTTWLGNDRILAGGTNNGAHPPMIIGLDKQIQWTGTSELASDLENSGAYNHDVGISADGKSIFATVRTTQPNGWTGYVLKQIDPVTNQVLWHWDSWYDGVLTGGLDEAGSSSNTDPYHANAIWDQWENGRLYLYVNMRNIYQTIKIDYQTKEVLWHLGYQGDFTLLEANGQPADDSRWFSDQHDAKVLGASYLVHDNGTDDYGLLDGKPSSRALRLELDDRAMTARISFEYGETGWTEAIWGGNDLLPWGNYLIAMGHCMNCGPSVHRSALVELSPAGKPVWRVEFRTESETFYRADHIDGCALFNDVKYCPALEAAGGSDQTSR